MSTWEIFLIGYLLIGIVRLGIGIAWMVHAARSRHPDYLKVRLAFHYAWETGAVAFFTCVVGFLVGIVCVWGQLVFFWPLCRWDWGTL
jgi:hypothetical protein